MNKEQFINSGLIEQYVLRITTPQEDAIVEEFSEKYPEIRTEIAQLQAAMEAYASEQSVPPPSNLKDRILNEIDTVAGPAAPGVEFRSRPSTLGRLVTGLALVASLILGVLLLNANQEKQQLENQLKTSKAEFAQFKDKCTRETSALAQQKAFITSPKTLKVTLGGSALAPNAEAWAYWNENQARGLLDLGTLPPCPEGKTYQIWADVEGEMINAGVLSPDRSDLQIIQFIENAESLNITLENAGGSDHPNVQMLQANGLIQA
ncbi:MAG: anti-sigma factor [Bacteroidota bacterium]